LSVAHAADRRRAGPTRLYAPPCARRDRSSVRKPAHHCPPWRQQRCGRRTRASPTPRARRHPCVRSPRRTAPGCPRSWPAPPRTPHMFPGDARPAAPRPRSARHQCKRRASRATRVSFRYLLEIRRAEPLQRSANHDGDRLRLYMHDVRDLAVLETRFTHYEPSPITRRKTGERGAHLRDRLAAFECLLRRLWCVGIDRYLATSHHVCASRVVADEVRRNPVQPCPCVLHRLVGVRTEQPHERFLREVLRQVGIACQPVHVAQQFAVPLRKVRRAVLDDRGRFPHCTTIVRCALTGSFHWLSPWRRRRPLTRSVYSPGVSIVMRAWCPM